MVFVVAEIGANWKGDIFLLERMVMILKSFGVSAVKLQALSKELIDRHPELHWYKNASVNPDNVKMINDLMSRYDIEWFCTPTYPEAVSFLDPYVKRWKIRHDDQNRHDIIKECEKTGKDIIVSVSKPNKDLLNYNKLKQIYCIPKYPTSYGEINFYMIKWLKGYSNHCLDPLACLRAVRSGIEYLEFHVTNDPNTFAIDNKVSFSYAQTEEIMWWIKLYEAS